MSSLPIGQKFPYEAARPLNQTKTGPRGWKVVLACLVASDILMLHIAIMAAYLLRFRLNLPFLYYETIESPGDLWTLELLLLPVAIAIFAFRGLYNAENLFGGTREYERLFGSVAFAMLAAIAIGYLSEGLEYSRGWLVIIWIAAFLLTAFGRFTMRRVVYALRDKGYLLKPAVIVGANHEGISLAEQLSYARASGLRLLGFLDDRTEPGRTVTSGLVCLGRPDQLNEIVQREGVQEIILARSALAQERILEIFQSFGVDTHANLRLSSGLYEIITTGMVVREIASVPLVRVNKVRLTGTDQVMKTALDYLITIPGLILCLPLFALIALAIRLDSPGPIFYRREVLGVNGKKFDAFKFRSMIVNGDQILAEHPDLQAELEENHKLRRDPRITRVGDFLRKTSLDELPQMVNVLRGEMSWVGPRMISPAEIDKYEQWGMNLLTVKPGITGKWQVSGRSDLTYEQRVHLDMAYIRNWTIWEDLRLLMQTIPAVLFRRGAY